MTDTTTTSTPRRFNRLPNTYVSAALVFVIEELDTMGLPVVMVGAHNMASGRIGVSVQLEDEQDVRAAATRWSLTEDVDPEEESPTTIRFKGPRDVAGITELTVYGRKDGAA